MSRDRRRARGWTRLTLWAALAPIPVYLAMFVAGSLLVALPQLIVGEEGFDSLAVPDAVGEFVMFCGLVPLPAALTGLVTAHAARLDRWWQLVPAATACAAVLVYSLVVVAAGQTVGDEFIVPVWPLMSLGALAGVALADYLTKGEGEEGDVGEPLPTQEDSPVGQQHTLAPSGQHRPRDDRRTRGVNMTQT